MPFDGAGTFAPPGADFPAVTLTTISSSKYNNVINDIATGLSNSVTRDGQSPWSANLPAGGFKITNMGAGTARADSARPAEVQDGTYLWGGTSGGTANAITFSLTPAITAYAAGQTFRFKAAASNTGAATVAINGLSAKAIQRNGVAIVGGDIVQDGIYQLLYDGTAFQLDSISVPAWTTGDAKLTYKTTADGGWVFMNDGTIGDATSGGTTRANADTEALFTLLWNNTANAQCAVSGGRGASAAADFAAHKTIALPKSLGRALAVAGSGSGLSARALALAVGTESKTIATANLPASGLSIPALGVSGSINALQVRFDNPAGPGPAQGYWPDAISITSGTLSGVGSGDLLNALTANSITGSTAGGTTGNMGSGTALDIMNPMQFLNIMVKL